MLERLEELKQELEPIETELVLLENQKSPTIGRVCQSLLRLYSIVPPLIFSRLIWLLGYIWARPRYRGKDLAWPGRCSAVAAGLL